MNFPRDQVSDWVEKAIDRLLAVDQYLLANDASERSVAFRLGLHLVMLGEIQPPLTVDAEFNRAGSNPKTLTLGGNSSPSAVFPDLLIHERGSNDNNVLVLEMKKPKRSLQKDAEKLVGYQRVFGYQHAAHLVLGSISAVGTPGRPRLVFL